MVLVTLPTHNEAPRLARSVELLKAAFSETGWDYRILIAEDGSTDLTHEVLRAIQQSIPEVMVKSYPTKLGRGLALRRAWHETRSAVYVYTDVDLPAGAQGVVEVARHVIEGADVAIGSRYLDGATVVRPPLVMFASKWYNRLVRGLFSDGVFDHQCGIKAFSHRGLEFAGFQAQSDSWFWDTEAIVIARHVRLKVEEVPLTWRETRYQRTSTRRLFREVPYFIGEIVRLSGRLGHGVALSNHEPIAEGTPSKTDDVDRIPCDDAHSSAITSGHR